jgi:uncharacterized protein (DUF885 family)
MRTFTGTLLALLFAFSTPLTASAGFSIADWKARVTQDQSIDTLGRLYLEFMLEENPTQGIQIGIHGKGDNPTYYDDRMPEISVEAWAAAYDARVFLLDHLGAIDAVALSRADQIDLHILKNKVALDQLYVSKLGDLTDPGEHVETLGTGLSELLLREYSPIEERLQSLGKRCAASGAFLEGARHALSPPYVQPTAVQKAVSVSRLRSMVEEGGLFDQTLPDMIATSSLSVEQGQAVKDACAVAVTQITTFADWLEEAIVPRPDGDWRLGRKLYEEKYALYMDFPLGPDELLAVAESELERVSAELVAIGRRIHDEYLAEEIAAGTVLEQAAIEDGQVVRNIFAKLSEDRSTTESLIEDSYALADAIVSFVREQNLMDLPPTSKLRIEPIPPHLAGYAVAMIQTAPPFEPELDSVWFWDLELLKGDPDFLKEYNRAALAMVYIHEGVPGHFVQLEYSNSFERIIPKVFWNGPMVEGWATYIETQLVEQGFTIYPDHPLGLELQQMTDQKLMLRSIMNAIIDIRLHTTDWPEEEAVKMMVEQGFQEEGEAQGKLVRAKLSSVQLASYFAGHHAIEEILAEYRELKGKDFSWKDFNQRLVGAGSPPFFAIREYMLSE